jgi:hypothetical protein
MGHRVGREMTEISQAKSPQRVDLRVIVDLLANMPGVAVPADRRVLLRDGGVRRDVAVEKIKRKGPEEVGDWRWEIPRFAGTDSPR